MGNYWILYHNVAKLDLGKVRLEPMQSAAPPLTVGDLWGGPWEICRAVVSSCIAHAFLPADRCGSFARYFCESLRILAPSHPSLMVAGL